MEYNATTVEEYIAALPKDRKPVIERLRNVILENLPEGFTEQISYGMIGYVVPLSRYPKGYHCKKDEPLPFISLASQKNHITLYHMGLYGNKELEKYFVEEYAKRVPTKLDMGKSCIRFKNPASIPFDLIAELCRKITLEEYVALAYETAKNQKEYFTGPLRNNVFQFSPIPWVSYTHISHTNSGKKDNATPIFDWGKYFERDGKVLLPFSVQAHHSFVDGIHIGKLSEILQSKLNEF